jgi:hypothetical protein
MRGKIKEIIIRYEEQPDGEDPLAGCLTVVGGVLLGIFLLFVAFYASIFLLLFLVLPAIILAIPWYFRKPIQEKHRLALHILYISLSALLIGYFHSIHKYTFLYKPKEAKIEIFNEKITVQDSEFLTWQPFFVGQEFSIIKGKPRLNGQPRLFTDPSDALCKQQLGLGYRLIGYYEATSMFMAIHDALNRSNASQPYLADVARIVKENFEKHAVVLRQAKQDIRFLGGSYKRLGVEECPGSRVALKDATVPGFFRLVWGHNQMRCDQKTPIMCVREVSQDWLVPERLALITRYNSAIQAKIQADKNLHIFTYINGVCRKNDSMLLAEWEIGDQGCRDLKFSFEEPLVQFKCEDSGGKVRSIGRILALDERKCSAQGAKLQW